MNRYEYLDEEYDYPEFEKTIKTQVSEPRQPSREQSRMRNLHKKHPDWKRGRD